MTYGLEINHSDSPTSTPWGKPDCRTEIAKGIWQYETPSHGGFWLSEERRQQMPERYRNIRTFCRMPGWYEEDCDWCLVALSFPTIFPNLQSDAEATYHWLQEHSNGRVS